MISRWACNPRVTRQCTRACQYKEGSMWTKPEYTEMRFGFEVTMYIANR